MEFKVTAGVKPGGGGADAVFIGAVDSDVTRSAGCAEDGLDQECQSLTSMTSDVSGAGMYGFVSLSLSNVRS